MHVHDKQCMAHGCIKLRSWLSLCELWSLYAYRVFEFVSNAQIKLTAFQVPFITCFSGNISNRIVCAPFALSISLNLICMFLLSRFGPFHSHENLRVRWICRWHSVYASLLVAHHSDNWPIPNIDDNLHIFTAIFCEDKEVTSTIIMNFWLKNKWE